MNNAANMGDVLQLGQNGLILDANAINEGNPNALGTPPTITFLKGDDGVSTTLDFGSNPAVRLGSYIDVPYNEVLTGVPPGFGLFGVSGPSPGDVFAPIGIRGQDSTAPGGRAGDVSFSGGTAYGTGGRGGGAFIQAGGFADNTTTFGCGLSLQGSSTSFAGSANLYAGCSNGEARGAIRFSGAMCPMVQYLVPNEGDTVVFENWCTIFVLNPATDLDALTITLPVSPFSFATVDAVRTSQIIKIACSHTITAVTFTANGGQTIYGAPSTIGPTSPVSFVWENTSSAWYRV